MSENEKRPASRRRRSAKVTLVVMAAGVTLAGCDQAPEQRNLYSSLEDCRRDWSIDKCEPVNKSGGGAGGGSGGGRYYQGPPHSGPAPAGSRSIGVTNVARGGFGGFGLSRGGFGGG